MSVVDSRYVVEVGMLEEWETISLFVSIESREVTGGLHRVHERIQRHEGHQTHNRKLDSGTVAESLDQAEKIPLSWI